MAITEQATASVSLKASRVRRYLGRGASLASAQGPGSIDLVRLMPNTAEIPESASRVAAASRHASSRTRPYPRFRSLA